MFLRLSSALDDSSDMYEDLPLEELLRDIFLYISSSFLSYEFSLTSFSFNALSKVSSSYLDYLTGVGFSVRERVARELRLGSVLYGRREMRDSPTWNYRGLKTIY